MQRPMKKLKAYGMTAFFLLASCLIGSFSRGSEMATQSIEFFRPLEGRWVRDADGVLSHLDIDVIGTDRVEIRVESCEERGPAKCAKALQTYFLKDENLIAVAGMKDVAATVDDLNPSRIAIRYCDPKDENSVIHAFELLNETVLSLNSKNVEAYFARRPR